MDSLHKQSGADYYHPEHTQQLINSLTFAASKGVTERVKAILAQSVPVDGKNDHGCTALYGASFEGQLDVVKLLLSQGADVNLHNANGVTALAVACDKGHYQVARFLIAKSADVNATDHENTTALLFATAHNDHATVQLLVENGSDPNIRSDKGNLPLCVATLYQQDMIIKLLLDHGADSNLIGYDGLSALAIAAAQGHMVNLKTLLQHDATPNLRNKQGVTALALAAGKDALGAIRLLLDGGADVDLTDDLGHTAVMYAISAGKIESVKMLLSAGADTQRKNEQGQTALSLAQAAGHDDIVRLLQVGSSKVKPTVKEATQAKNPVSNEAIEAEQPPDLDALQNELNALTGMPDVKANVAQLVNFLKFQQMRKAKGLLAPDQSLHMVFTGNPGTGKTTIARLIAKIYKGMGILSGGQFVEADRAQLVGGFLGQTAIKTQEVVKSALGGVLFIDEAYSLTQRGIAGGDAYGEEAVNTLLKMMEDQRDDLIVIVAGYTEPMQKFIRSNPGLQSRFNKFLHFDDYAPAELTEIFRHFAAQGDYTLHPATELKLTNVFSALYAQRDETFGNARLARNLFEKAINAHANRMVSVAAPDEASLVTLYPADIPNA